MTEELTTRAGAVQVRPEPPEPSIYSLGDPAVNANPYTLYRHLLDHQPVTESSYGTVLVKYEDCAAVLRDSRFSSDDRNAIQQRELASSPPPEPGQRAVLDQRSFLRLDPPDHTRLRRLATKAFTPSAVEALRAVVQQMVDEAIDGAAPEQRTELIADLAYPLPITVISRLLGIPPEDHLAMQSWSRATLCCSFETSTDHSNQIQCDLAAYFDRLIAERRRRPGDDLLSALIAAEERGDQLTTEEINATCRLLLVAGHETTVSLIGNGMLALLRNPDQLRLLRENPPLAPGAVEEVLRYDAPFQFTQRVALEDVEVRGVPIRRGQPVFVFLAAANRDPDRFEDPDRFDITRPDNRHLGLGTGIHACLGGPLARLQGQIALYTLAARLVDPVLEIDPPPYRRTGDFHALEALPVAFRGVRPTVTATMG